VFSTYDQVILWLSVLLALSTVVVSAYRGAFLSYFWLNFYLLSSAAFTIGCYYVQSAFGYDSDQYYYFYYVGDAIPNIVGYVLIGTFFDRLLRNSAFHKYVRPTLAMAFLLLLAISGRFIWGSIARLNSRFVYEFQQDIYFVGVLLTFLLWLSMGYLRAQSRRFALLVSGLGIYFAIHAGNYALQFLAPALRELVYRVPPLAYIFMVAVWCYAFLRVPEEGVAAVVSARSVSESSLAAGNRAQ
jgi:hypothetical protein